MQPVPLTPALSHAPPLPGASLERVRPDGQPHQAQRGWPMAAVMRRT